METMENSLSNSSVVVISIKKELSTLKKEHCLHLTELANWLTSSMKNERDPEKWSELNELYISILKQAERESVELQTLSQEPLCQLHKM